MSKKLAVGRRKVAMTGKLSATKRELADIDQRAARATQSKPQPATRSKRKATSR